jgi:hypothetical protein
MAFSNRIQDIFGAIKATPARRPSRIQIPAECVDRPEKLGPALERNKNYFQVRVNEMFLANQRKWFQTIDPMVFVSSEFTYDNSEVTIPFVLGPSMIKGQQTPAGMVFSDTRVAGIHPYRGGRLALTVILYSIVHTNLARQFLNVVENVAGALDFSAAVVTYAKLAGALLDGVEALAGMNGTVPIVGYRREIDPDAGDDMTPGYFALIDMPEEELRRNYKLFVRDNRLCYGDNIAAAREFRAADFVLLSTSSRPDRGDIDSLPFHPLWQRVLREASVPKPDNWESAKSNMLSLYQTMVLSPDLTRDHARKLARDYGAEMQATFDEAVNQAKRSGRQPSAAEDEMDDLRGESLKLLKL